MEPSWKGFVDELLDGIQGYPREIWYKKELIAYIKDKQIQFLERTLKIIDDRSNKKWIKIQNTIDHYEKIYQEDRKKIMEGIKNGDPNERK